VHSILFSNNTGTKDCALERIREKEVHRGNGRSLLCELLAVNRVRR
jgi:hypothetical protein